MEQEHKTWLRENQSHLACTIPVRALLEELCAKCLFIKGSEEYETIAGLSGTQAGEALVMALWQKDMMHNGFQYFLQAVYKICPDVLFCCKPREATIRYLLSSLGMSERCALYDNKFLLA